MVNSVSGVQQNYFDYILFRFFSIINWASPVAQMVMNPPAMQETWVQSLDREDPLDEGMATHSSIILAWRILMVREAWWATVHGVEKSQT